jgi:hypothetical protein
MTLIICSLTVCGAVPLIIGILINAPIIMIGGIVIGAASSALAVLRKINHEIDHMRIIEP